MIGKKQPASVSHCSLAHDMINKLSIIVGQCELLEEEMAQAKYAERLQIIRRTALAMAVTINRNSCENNQLDELKGRRESTTSLAVAQ